MQYQFICFFFITVKDVFFTSLKFSVISEMVNTSELVDRILAVLITTPLLIIAAIVTIFYIKNTCNKDEMNVFGGIYRRLVIATSICMIIDLFSIIFWYSSFIERLATPIDYVTGEELYTSEYLAIASFRFAFYFLVLSIVFNVEYSFSINKYITNYPKKLFIIIYILFAISLIGGILLVPLRIAFGTHSDILNMASFLTFLAIIIAMLLSIYLQIKNSKQLSNALIDETKSNSEEMDNDKLNVIFNEYENMIKLTVLTLIIIFAILLLMIYGTIFDYSGMHKREYLSSSIYYLPVIIQAFVRILCLFLTNNKNQTTVLLYNKYCNNCHNILHKCCIKCCKNQVGIEKEDLDTNNHNDRTTVHI